MEEFLFSIKLVLGALGHRILEPLSPVGNAVRGFKEEVANNQPNSETYEFSFKGLKATGTQTDEGFVVFAGSDVSKNIQPSTPNSLKLMRKLLVDEKILCESNEELEFKNDYLFNSPSQAASVVAGSSRNGRDAWKNRDGNSIKDLEDLSIS